MLNTSFPITFILHYHILIGLSVAWFALFLMRGWWPVVVSIPAASATISLYGQPYSALLYVIGVAVVTWIYRNKMADDAVERGYVVFAVIILSLFGLGPLSFLSHHFLLGLSYESSRIIAYKSILNANLSVLLAYFVYVVFKLVSGGRSEYKPNSISVSGIVFLSSYGIIAFIVLAISIFTHRILQSEIINMYHGGLKAQSISIWKQFEDSTQSPADIRSIRETLAPGVDFQIIFDNKDVFSSDHALFNLLESDYKVSLNRFSADQVDGFNLIVPAQIDLLRHKMADSYYRVSSEYSVPNQSIVAKVNVVQNAEIAILDDVRVIAEDFFKFLSIVLSLAAVYSLWLSSRAGKEINILFSVSHPFLPDAGDLDSANDIDSISSSPVFRYSPIREISKGVDIINRNFNEIRDSRDSIRQLNAIAQKQLTNAGTIQQCFLVKDSPSMESIDLSLFMKPAYNAGGDWYDAFSVGDKLFLVIADVCDKGVPAALFMSVFRSLIRYDTVSRPRWNLSDEDVAKQMVNVITHVNDYMSINHGDDVYFATVLFVVLDQKTGLLTYISAGHESPLIFLPSHECIQLETTGPAVGIFKNSLYFAKSLLLPKGSAFVGFTDGVIDARNELDQSFTNDRLISLCRHLLVERPDVSSSDFMDSIKQELMSHIGKASQFDDITLAVFNYR
jgi:serine phosphatase RsbU (regulator of sigma subunit)